MQYYIFGLGNPGEQYAKTRHNAGQIIAALLQKSLADQPFKFVDSKEFMNHSGRAVPASVKPKALIVIHDELDLPLGTFRLSFDRSAAGHHGVESVIKKIKSQEFVRVRVGIGRPKKVAVVDYILSEFKKPELAKLTTLAKKIGEALICLADESLAKAMTLYN